ncbi:4-coumarate--CoA ligase-like 1 [Cytospora mali]|uniref:4-coumarate--CoA ligase-like 1 n=1 Tax=Cytospora mali TaxID=578113 RepID=A0A194VBA4_CYTMA|nr:4-coumarate--CoA ligase-like 1 [Valsa mali var. pyri (nom. inval.)]
MPVFKSKHPDIDLPMNVTIWEWLFDERSKASPLNGKIAERDLAGYTDAITKERVSWKDVRDNATYISTALVRKYGFKPGQTMSLFSRNTIWYPVTMFAAVRVGGVVSGASPAYNVQEMTYSLRIANANFIATHPTSMKVAVEAARNAGIPKEHIFLLEGKLDGYTTIQDLIHVGKSFDERDQVPYFQIPLGKKNKDICAFLSFSSGTTGLPKAVMIAHQNVIAQCLQIKSITPENNNKKVLGVLPLFHITGITHAMHTPVARNAEVIMLPMFTMDSMLSAIVEYQIKELLLVPPLIIRFVRDPVVDNYDLSCIEVFSSGAAPISEEILGLLKRKFPGTGFKQGYGMTESCSCITAHPPEAYSFDYSRTAGTIMPGTEVKIIKDDGTEAGVGEPGEILARGPQIVMGYLGNSEATKETFDEEGFLHTGDQGFMDRDGFITITDRIKEMIKVKGIGVAPAELEDCILGHPKVEDCAVLQIPDDWAGERPKAYVVLKPGMVANQSLGEEIMRHVEKRKVRHNWIKEVEFIDQIPKSASGKILRRVLRDRARSGFAGVVVRRDPAAVAKL